MGLFPLPTGKGNKSCCVSILLGISLLVLGILLIPTLAFSQVSNWRTNPPQPQQQSQPVMLQQQPTIVQPLIRPQQLPHVPQHQQQQPLVVPPPQQQQHPPPLVHESERKSVLRRGRNPNTSQQDRKVSHVVSFCAFFPLFSDEHAVIHVLILHF